jgi:hypothetical protein
MRRVAWQLNLINTIGSSAPMLEDAALPAAGGHSLGYSGFEGLSRQSCNGGEARKLSLTFNCALALKHLNLHLGEPVCSVNHLFGRS